jgi:DNA polymerase-3 subunit delta
MPVHLITGDDESLLLTAVSEVVHRLVGGGERSLMVDEFDDDEYEVRSIVDAAQTPPFLTESRVVIARGVGRFGADDVRPLVAYLGDPLPSTELVLVGGGGRLAKALTEAIKKTGGTVVDTAPPTRARERGGWFEEQVIAAGLRLDHNALGLLASWLGEDAGRVQGILETLVSTYGDSRTLKVVDVEPFLGEAGGVPPWDLTDAVDRGETTKALLLLHRMMRAGERHPLQVMAILHGHYTKLLTLDGANATDESSAAAVLGIRPGFPARKALDQYRKLGSGAVVRAIGMLAQADLDLRGAKEWPDELVMEVLVARLSRLGAGRR